MTKGNQPPPEESLPPVDPQPPQNTEDLWPQLEAKINECTQLSQTLEETMELNQRLETKCKSLEQLREEDSMTIQGLEEQAHDLRSELDALKRTVAASTDSALPPAHETGGETLPENDTAAALDTKTAECEALREDCLRLKRELHEANVNFKGILRFLNDPSNSVNEKRNVLQRELAKP